MRRLLPNRGSSGAGRCGPSTSPTCDQQRRSLVRPTPRTKHHRTKENPAHASQHAQVEERQAQRQTKSTEEGSSGVQNCASNLQQQKRAAESNSSTRSTEKTLRSQSLQSQGTIANSTKTPSPQWLRTTREELSRPNARTRRRGPTGFAFAMPARPQRARRRKKKPAFTSAVSEAPIQTGTFACVELRLPALSGHQRSGFGQLLRAGRSSLQMPVKPR